ncbi:FDXHR family putative zinc-binding protein [Plantactinospora alkalitolerans]
MERLSASCGGCDARWTGVDAAHCVVGCHRTYADVDSYEAHLRGGVCLDPKDARLISISDGECEKWLGPAVEFQAWVTSINTSKDRSER